MGKKTILVTGGAGFIGSHLIEKLLAEGACVYSLDDYSTGKKENHIQGANYIKGSTKDIARLVTFKPDLIYHLGEYARVEKSFDDTPLVWESNNGVGTKNFSLELASLFTPAKTPSISLPITNI